MSEFSRLLDSVMDDYGILDKQLALLCGKDRSMISRYRYGEYSCPWELIPHLWKLTRDQRLISYLFAGVIVIDKPEPASGIDAMREMIEAQKKRIAFEETILEMLEDGRIDGKDDIDKFIRTSGDSLAAEIKLTETIKAEYRRNTGRKVFNRDKFSKSLINTNEH